jgi:sugar O-acyltransferase (sialic acid O-acetyltransferase NeuD family)
MKKEIYGIFGAGGYGREVMPLARNQLVKQNKSLTDLFFVVDKPEVSTVNGITVLSLDEFIKIDAKIKYLAFAIGQSEIRQSLVDKINGCEISHWSVIAENCVVMDEVVIGEGAILSPFVTITSNVTIGRCFHANIYSYIGHDCILGDFVTFAPGVKCNGNVIIEDGVFIGTGAIILPGTKKRPRRLGNGCKVAAGAVVTKDIASFSTVIGNPAIELTKENLRKWKAGSM